MASGKSVDLQREDRWQGQTQAGTVTVDVDALEDPVNASEEDVYMSALS